MIKISSTGVLLTLTHADGTELKFVLSAANNSNSDRHKAQEVVAEIQNILAVNDPDVARQNDGFIHGQRGLRHLGYPEGSPYDVGYKAGEAKRMKDQRGRDMCKEPGM